jgi:hypothetical protein
MSEELGKMVRERLGKDFVVKKLDIGGDATLKKSMFKFFTESYEVEGAGHLCVLSMKAMFGLMKMETVVFAPFSKDAPLINTDRVSVMGKDTVITELYNDQLEPYPAEYLEAFDAIKAKDKDLEDYVSEGAHWYDPILYPCSYHKKGKGVSERLFNAAKAYTDTYADQFAKLPDCDKEAKKAKVKDFAEKLFSNGGPAVNQVRKLFGDEVAQRLILKHMYGVE